MRSDQRERRDEPFIEVSTNANADAVVVRLGGELDMYTIVAIRGALFDAVRGATGTVVVDLEDVEFLDSTALATFVEARRRLRNSESFLLAAPGLEPRRALEVSGLDRHFRVYATVDEALAAAR
jgi:anti-sigma B factor antagonist